MRRSQRLIAATVLIALSGVLGGCSSGNFDPSDLLDFFDTKKKLPGERKPVFPDGVPGLEQGVPKELYKGAQQQQEEHNGQADAAAAAAAPEQPAPRTKQAKAKTSKPIPTANGAPAADSPAVAPDGEAKPAEDTGPAQAPKARKLAHKRTTPPPDSPPEQPGQPALHGFVSIDDSRK